MVSDVSVPETPFLEVPHERRRRLLNKKAPGDTSSRSEEFGAVVEERPVTLEAVLKYLRSPELVRYFNNCVHLDAVRGKSAARESPY